MKLYEIEGPAWQKVIVHMLTIYMQFMFFLGRYEILIAIMLALLACTVALFAAIDMIKMTLVAAIVFGIPAITMCLYWNMTDKQKHELKKLLEEVKL